MGRQCRLLDHQKGRPVHLIPDTVMERGFTLIELMITITVLGIMLALGLPSFVETIQNLSLIHI